uniref:Uncharacterized protein n=1 Tax=Panagrolaimus superbus TaxID=310955 RepID=A0A914YFU0_9BILA
MPRFPAAKKLKQEQMRENQRPKASENQRPKASQVSPNVMTTAPDSEEYCGTKSYSNPLSDAKKAHLRRLHETNDLKRQITAAKKNATVAKLTLISHKRTSSVFMNSSSDTESSINPDNQEIEPARLKHSSSINLIPVTPSRTPFISRQVLTVHTPSLASSLKSPENLSRSGFYKRLKATRERTKHELGAGYRITNSPERKVSVEEAAKYKVMKRLTDEQYQGLDSRHYPGLTAVRKYLKELSEKLEALEKDGLAQAIINHVNALEEFSRDVIRINIGIDKGSDTVKIVCFFTGDCKIKDEVTGLQGGSATCPCVYCMVPSAEWQATEFIPEWMLRSIDELLVAGEEVENAEESGTLKPTQLSNLKKTKKSVKARPMLKNIPITRFCPPIVHIGISAVSATVKYCKGKSTVIQDEINTLGLKTHQGTSDYTGPNCQRILKHFEENPEINGLGTDLLRSFAKIESYFVARDLKDEEIVELDEAIKTYFALIDDKYPDFLGKKTKLHILRHHVITFAIEFGSLGRFSEQSLESIHRIKNLCDTRIPGNSEAAKERKVQYFTKQQRLINHFTNEGSK